MYFRLFLETINEHPDFKNVPVEERNLNYRALRDVLPKTEKIKTKLLEQYSTEYELYQEKKVKIIFKLYNLMLIFMFSIDKNIKTFFLVEMKK